MTDHSDFQTKHAHTQVTSDSQLTPQLYMLGLEEVADFRPPWGSTLVYELYRDKGASVPVCSELVCVKGWLSAHVSCTNARGLPRPRARTFNYRFLCEFDSRLISCVGEGPLSPLMFPRHAPADSQEPVRVPSTTVSRVRSDAPSHRYLRSAALNAQKLATTTSGSSTMAGP